VALFRLGGVAEPGLYFEVNQLFLKHLPWNCFPNPGNPIAIQQNSKLFPALKKPWNPWMKSPGIPLIQLRCAKGPSAMVQIRARGLPRRGDDTSWPGVIDDQHRWGKMAR